MRLVRLFGTTAVVVTDTTLLTGDALGDDRSRRLLARLALAAPGPVPLARLERDLGRPTLLRRDAATLAHALGAPGLVVEQDDGWMLRPGWARVDVQVAHALFARAVTAPPTTTLALVLRALRSCCTATLLASEDDAAPWVLEARTRHDRLLRDALVRAAAAARVLHDEELADDLLARALTPAPAHRRAG
ncbi:hypothetical protein [Arthrobacter sp. NEB 688]|uniref:hypothetical protein n=1 Tax=Arthrobacter sp. NEB 688 TaxID=904039 RepID=UPI0015637126|nr:hypothetical protein [Arthrobacter sp. NEB 688]QKE85212.1 hypothetical protein HL663_15545 [Arthrobacter sp. NEB 688]